MEVAGQAVAEDTQVRELLAAAAKGDCGKIGELLRADSSLLKRSDACGRTALHHAVAERQLVAVKYLVGRWDAGVCLLTAVDEGGNTPLHLIRGPKSMLVLLLHAGVSPPIDVPNVQGLVPSIAVAKAMGMQSEDAAALFEQFQQAKNLTRDEEELLAFLPSSPLRSRLRHSRFWFMRLNKVDIRMTSAVLVVTALFCCHPTAAGCTSLAAIVLELIVLDLRSRISVELVSLLLCLAVSMLVALTIHFSLVPHLTWKHCIYLMTLITSYGHLCLVGPSRIIGTHADAQKYWEALELQTPSAGMPTMAGFCTRSEAVRPPRSKYSPLSECLVPVMDHDCAFVGCAIGEGNHRVFMAFLLSAAACLFVFLRRANDYMRATPDLGDIERRAFVVGLNIDIGLLGFLLWLIGSQIWSIELNYTHAELDRWQRQHPGEIPPRKWWSDVETWHDYMPYDKGRLANLIDWILARRASAALNAAARPAEAKKAV
eukprot:scaffold41776_cov37-Tisochrysis_lutea.AAC.1